MIYAELSQLERDMQPVWDALAQAMESGDAREQKHVRKIHRRLARALTQFRSQRAAKSLDRDTGDGHDVFAVLIDTAPQRFTKKVTI